MKKLDETSIKYIISDLVLLGIGTMALVGVETCAFNSYSKNKNSIPKITAPLNQKGLEKKLTPQEKPKSNIFYNGYTQFA